MMRVQPPLIVNIKEQIVITPQMRMRVTDRVHGLSQHSSRPGIEARRDCSLFVLFV